MKIGLAFGSFNPITIAHIEMANSALQLVDEVWFIISPQNPFKNPKDLAPFDERFKMVEMVCKKNPKFKAIDIEVHLDKPSYTINTLRELHKLNKGENEYSIIIGTDAINRIQEWKEWEEIVKSNKFIIFVRDNKNLNNNLEDKLQVVGLLKSFSIVSSTIVRNFIKEGKPITGLVSTDVEVYLQVIGLYK